MSNHRKYRTSHRLVAAAAAILMAGPVLAADEPPIQATALLPRDLSPWGMFTNADMVVKAVMVGLVIASVVTWTVWLAKTIELLKARRRVRSAIGALVSIETLADVKQSSLKEPAASFCAAALAELRLSDGAMDKDGLKERIASRLERIEAAFSRRISRGTGVLATIGATAPFIGLFGTVWGIMNSFIGISKSHTTNWRLRQASPKRCSRPRSDLRPRSRRSSSTICFRGRLRPTGPRLRTHRRKCCDWSVATLTAACRCENPLPPQRSSSRECPSRSRQGRA
jgi:tonB-system energizer ExbB